MKTLSCRRYLTPALKGRDWASCLLAAQVLEELFDQGIVDVPEEVVAQMVHDQSSGPTEAGDSALETPKGIMDTAVGLVTEALSTLWSWGLDASFVRYTLETGQPYVEFDDSDSPLKAPPRAQR
ncbi:MAG: hypothetical protein JSS66_07715 [Armatimonadetes bacterium]|nr:hypothetical protein [Armatimonadota bacterium]